MEKVIVVGLGKSGVAAARLLRERGDTVFITEIRDEKDTRASLEALVKDGVVQPCNVELGKHSKRFIEAIDLMVVSPGVRGDREAVGFAEEKDIPIISELELAYSVCPAPIIAVTGTSGKTTVTTLIGEMFKNAGLDVVVCGNIGSPFSGEIKRIKKDSIVVLEVSSFQLERIKSFKPSFGIILNISENHLDRHKDMEEYVSSKLRIFSNQDEKDILFLNGKDKILRKASRKIKRPKVEFFDEYKDFSKTYNIENENSLAAMSIASLKGIGEGIMLDVLSNFKGIEHRLEYVDTINGIDCINDSKATTVSSVEWALKSLSGRLILIMGGRYKGGDFGSLKRFVKEKAGCVIAIGEARERIKKDLSNINVIEEGSLEKAVDRAFSMAEKGDKIVLSPGCSSFDMFKNYEERGRTFKDLCRIKKY